LSALEWQEVGHLAFGKQTPQPFNLPPLQTVLLRLTGTLTFPYMADLEEGTKIVANYLTNFVRQPFEMKLELHSLNNRIDTAILISPTEVVASTPPVRSSAAA
jgi:hypothetical protein